MKPKTTTLPVKISKYDKQWSKLVRERDKYVCQVCKKVKDKFTAHAHHYLRRSIKPTRLEVDNGITLCFQCHTANHNFSAHRTPTEFKKWFEENFPDRAKRMQEKARTHMSELMAIKEFIAKYEN